MPSPLPISLSGRFRVEEVLADTPCERCFRAFDEVLQREVLLKLPARAAFAGWTAPVKERLLREARALARIRHENVAPIHHVEDTPEGPLLVLDLPRGEPLAERLQRGTLEAAAVVELGMQVGEALAAVHMQGVVHRAVGPSTIRLLANGKVELGAFTFAKEFGPGSRGTSLVHARTGDAAAVVARHLPEYAAPEQLAGQAADPRADVFALGCTLFRCLVGRDAFSADGDHSAPADLGAVPKDAGRVLAEVIRKCLLFAKSARYATAREVVDALRSVPAQSPIGGAKRGRIVAMVAVVTLLVGGWAMRDSWAAAPRDRAEGVPVAPLHDGYGATFQGSYHRVHGLFIAIGEGYSGKEWHKLRNPVREIDAVIAQLQANDPMWRAADAIDRLVDEQATGEGMRRALERLEERAGKEDAVLVYFAGHGASFRTTFGLCGVDAAGPVASEAGYLRRDELQNFAIGCRSKHVLFVLDCCYSGAVFDDDQGLLRGRDPTEPQRPEPGDRLRSRFSREFLCSAGPKQEARDGEHLSPFCEQLLAQLREPATAARPYLAAFSAAGSARRWS